MKRINIKEKYSEAEEIVRSMCNVRYPKNVKTSHRKYMKIFNELLQGIMLFSILTDKVVSEEEKELLKNTSFNGNVISRINSQARFENPEWVDVTIETIDTLTEEKQMAILRILPPSMELSVQAFAKSFSKMDYDISSRDYFDELREIVEAFVVEAITADGDCMECQRAGEEYEAAKTAFVRIFWRAWEKHSGVMAQYQTLE